MEIPQKDLFCPNKIFDNGSVSIGEFKTKEETDRFPLHGIWCINREEDNKFQAYQNQHTRIFVICSWNRSDNDILKFVLALIHSNGKIYYWNMNDLPLYPENKTKDYLSTIGQEAMNALNKIASINKQNITENKIHINMRRIRLTETQLHRVIKESVRKILKEEYCEYPEWVYRIHSKIENGTATEREKERYENFVRVANDGWLN